MTAVGSKPLRAQEAEKSLAGKTPNASVLDKAVKLAVDDSKPVTDVTASEEYRRRVLGILVKDALELAYNRAVMGDHEKS
jgi:carbon-monoxide dehydrogenase medium subunit